MFQVSSEVKFFYRDGSRMKFFQGVVLEDSEKFVCVDDRKIGKTYLKKDNIERAEEVHASPDEKHKCSELRIVGRENEGKYLCDQLGCENYMMWEDET